MTICMVISLLKIPYVHRIYMYKYMVLANPIYTVYTVIRCIYGHIRYMEIPYTVWANLSIPESHVWSWENGPSCILRLHLMQCHVPSPPHAVPCPLSTTCSALSHLHHMQCHVPSPPHAVPCPLSTTCSALSPLHVVLPCPLALPHAVPCPLPPPHARRGIQNEKDVHAPCLPCLWDL